MRKQYGTFQVLHTIATKRVKVVESFYWQSYHSVLHGNLKFVSCHIIRIISAVSYVVVKQWFISLQLLWNCGRLMLD